MKAKYRKTQEIKSWCRIHTKYLELEDCALILQEAGNKERLVVIYSLASFKGWVKMVMLL